MSKPALAVHGGAGTIFRSEMTPELEAQYRSGIENALRAGWAVLQANGNSLDAVDAAVRQLEDFPLFNAGRGSVFTHDGQNEMDAAIMDGHSKKAGAVAFIRNVKNPIGLARLVMERTEHVLLAGEGAILFAEEMNVELADNAYFYTDNRWKQLEQAIAAGRVQLDHAGAVHPKPIGTVGAVACDVNGHLAAATSTGGMTNKKFGRVGDTPIIGAGTYADEFCAVSCTGHGEYFMTNVTAFDVAARMKYSGLSLEDAAQESIDHLTKLEGEGGLIAVDAQGNISLPFNSEGMYRGSVNSKGETAIAIYRQ
ncbi:MAG TPA: isoaspartyl peptidase/L-asparaginase [Pyrinomonadaceae bacterium]|nr:isoaspartyl peptidase/L-asparaginase [Chloracidobacterium sp.]MBP9934581.1 isoaspartyl peptidase/L-asparaginase [Pyrinomonadaceae bacterium]MBK7802870.1 isoaspartyl peptidase/L-asparaginase [Chloracidobacterium sp.]MBK9438488.1 isoaspartyl peptidase/L-asparaginase [Chloracidobacterium sp.]MBL0240633.1 isoaspartyl peptidase/L-asparaginase [Chloracidobacterium sp.]